MQLTINDKKRVFRGPPFKRLIDVLRQDFGLTGTKEGCSEGECGACTVLVDGIPVVSCLVPVAQMKGRSIKTVESLAQGQSLNSLQRSFLEHGGTQCGICAPGMLMTATSYLSKNKQPDSQKTKKALMGNLCRCTGYQPIIDSVIGVSKKKRRKA